VVYPCDAEQGPINCRLASELFPGREFLQPILKAWNQAQLVLNDHIPGVRVCEGGDSAFRLRTCEHAGAIARNDASRMATSKGYRRVCAWWRRVHNSDTDIQAGGG
jgi:hypothetical protein